MDASLIFSVSAQTQAALAPAPAHAASNAESPAVVRDTVQINTPNGRKFAGLMRDLLPTHERQKIAAATATDPSGLKSETLGGELEVITAKGDQTDTGSLTAFARAQGLDESALLALFGDKPSPDMPSALSLDGTTALNAALLNAQAINLPPQTGLLVEAALASSDLNPDVAWMAQHLSAEITLRVSSVIPETSTPLTVAVDASALTTANWLATQVTSLVQAPVKSAAATIVTLPSTEAMAEGISAMQTTSPSALPTVSKELSALGTLVNASVITEPPTLTPASTGLATLSGTGAMALPVVITAPSTLTPVSTGLATLSGTGAMALPVANQPNAPATTDMLVSELDDLTPAAPTPQDAMRIRLVPAWESVTQQLHQMSGSSITVAWGALTTANLGAPIRSIALDLRESAAQELHALDEIDFSANTDNNLNSLGADLNRTTATGTPLLATAQSLPGMAQTQRQEYYQLLADRLGQAMAERLQSQIARGEWKLQMRLNPANLGRIDVELDMHAKGLDAMFRSDNPLTRELMAQSMAKLRDTLTQSGMAVASVWVNSDSGRQSGGNPTPQRESAPHSEKEVAAQADTVTKAVTKEKRTPDGFDVLA